MNQSSIESASDELAQLGKPKLVFCISKKTLVWGFLLATLPCVMGLGVFLVLLQKITANWPNKVLNDCALGLPVAGLMLWSGIAFATKTNRKRRVRVVVHDSGFSYRNENYFMICRWDQIAELRLRKRHFHDGGVVWIGPVPIAASDDFVVHNFVVRKHDGIELVFTEELQNVLGLADVIGQELERSSGRRRPNAPSSQL